MRRRRRESNSPIGRLAIMLGVLMVAAWGVYRLAGPDTQGPGATSPAPSSVPGSEPQVTDGVISLDRNFYIVFDGSGSMLESSCAGQFRSRLEGAKWAVNEFTTQNVPAHVNLGLYAFDAGGSRERVPLGKENRDEIRAQVQAIRGGGGTPLDAAITAGVNALATQRARQLGYGEFYLVVATDGEATDVSEARNAVRLAARQAIPIITIGFCLGQRHALATASLSYRDADNPQTLLAALRETQGESPYFDSTVFQRR